MKQELNSFKIWPERHIVHLTLLLALFIFIAFSGWFFYLRSVIVKETDGMINVVNATFGGNCYGSENNLRPWIRSACSGKKSCSFILDDRLLGYSRANCNRQVRIEWKCYNSGPIFLLDETPNNAHGTQIQLICN